MDKTYNAPVSLHRLSAHLLSGWILSYPDGEALLADGHHQILMLMCVSGGMVGNNATGIAPPETKHIPRQRWWRWGGWILVWGLLGQC